LYGYLISIEKQYPCGRKLMGETVPNPLMQFVPLIIFSLVFGLVVARALAKDKGRNVLLWTLLGCIPVVNIFCIPFFVGAANIRLEQKVDAILKALEQNSPPSA
jgi:hypothetical protein